MNSKKDCFCYCSAYDLSGVLETLGAKMTSEVDERRFLGNAYVSRAATGERSGELTLGGIYDSTSTASLIIPSGAEKVWIAGFETDDESKRVWCYGAAQVSEGEIVIEDGKLDSVNPVIAINGQVNEGYVVAPLTARTTAGNTQATYADMETSGTGCRAFIIVTSITLGGYTSLTVTPQSCATSGGSYDDETAFSAVTAAGGEAITLAGTVNRYLALKWAWNGSGSGQSATFFVAVSRD